MVGPDANPIWPREDIVSALHPDEAGLLLGMQIQSRPFRISRQSRDPRDDEESTTDRTAVIEDALRLAREEGLEQGRSEGLRSGYEEGLRQGQAEAGDRVRDACERAVADALRPLQEERARLAMLLQQLESIPRECLAGTEDELVALCYEVLARILGTAVDVAVVRAHLAHLSERFGTAGILELRVHPQDVALMDASTTEQGERRPVRWVADPEIALGGCIAVRPGGSLDARLETILASCKATLLRARSARETAAGKGEA